MSFLSPLFLFGALAAAIPIVLHLLRNETEAHVKFSAVKLLRHAPVEAARKQRLREWMLLALRVTALLLLALAFARPFVAAQVAAGSGLTVVALDTSLSMSAPGQFARAQQLARDAIGGAPAGKAVAVVTFDDTARITAAPGAERAVALAAVESASAGFGATNYRAALNAASEAIVSHGGGPATIVVVTDLQESGWDAGDRASLPESANVEIADPGARSANLAVTSVRIDEDGDSRIVGVVRNAGDQARQVRVRLAIDGNNAGEATVSIEANQSAEVAFRGPRGVAATVSVDDPDGIQGDNVRYVVLDRAGRPSVLVVTANGDLPRDAFYVEQALVAEGDDGAQYAARGVAAPQLSSWDGPRLDEQNAIVLLSTRGLERPGRDLLTAYLSRGGGMLAAAGDEVDGEVLAELVGGPAALSLRAVAGQEQSRGPTTLAPSDGRHPVFQAFGAEGASLGFVTFQRFMAIGGTCQSLAKFTTGETALADCTPGEGRALVFASDLDNRWNDFPVHATFVPFVHEAIRYVAGARPRRGEYLVGEVPEGVPSKPGIATVSDAAGGARRSVAVNVDPSESDARRLPPDEFQAAVTRLKDVSRATEPQEGERQEDRQRIWRYVLGLMAATLVVESLAARR